MPRDVRRRALAAAAVCCALAAPLRAVERVDGPPETVADELASDAYRVFDARDGLPQASVYALAQDAEGTVYAGTEDGVAQFDGLHWAPLPMPPAAAPSEIARLLVDRDDALWAADDIFGLLRRAPGGTLQPVPFDAAGPRPIVDLALPHGDGVWAASETGLFRCGDAGCRAVPALDGQPVAAMLAGEGPEGPCLWLGIEGRGLFRLDAPDSAQPQLVGPVLSQADGLPNDSLRSLASWHGDLWIGSGRGLARWNGTRLTVYSAQTGFTDGIVRALQPGYDADGQPRLLAAQWPGGVVELRPDGSWRRLGTRNGLPEDSAVSLLDVQGGPERRGALWIGTLHSGVARREPGSWQATDERAGLPHRAVIGMGRVALPDGSLRYWLGTLRGSVAWIDGRWAPWLPDELAGERVFSAASADGAVWLGTGRGLVRWQDGRVDTFTPANAGLPGLVVIGVYAQPRATGPARIWYATRHGMGFVDDGAVQVDRAAMALVDNQWFRAFAESGTDGPMPMLWAASAGGLLFDRGAGWERIARDCLPHHDVTDLRLQPDADGREQLWVATRGGIVRIDPRSFACTRIAAAELDRPTVYQLQFDRRGRLYAFGYDGVRRLRFEPGADGESASVQVERIGIADGLPSLEFNRASLVDARGRLWGGSNGGLAIFDPAAEPTPAEPAPLRLLDARVGDARAALAPGARLAATDNTLRFDYRLLTARREHRNRYRTQLDGLDPQPREWTAAAGVDYSRVPPGDYTFRLWAEDEHGLVSGPETIAFSIAYPLWRQPWALAGYALLLVGIGMAIGRWRARTVSARADALAREIGARTAELAEANLRLEQASRTDPLTGLWNRRHFYEALPGLLQHSPRLALLLIDIDHFKRINDTHGHDVGDAVLREFARRLRLASHDNALALRWGGEEFLLALPDHAAPEAARRAALVLATMHDEPFVCDSGALAVTCSIGWLCLPWTEAAGGPGLTIDQALALADCGLYRAKELGRNRAMGVLPGRADDPRPQPHLPPVRFASNDGAAVGSLVPFRR